MLTSRLFWLFTVFPELLPPEKRAKGDWRDLDIVSENVGLRPTRHGGVRLEKDSISSFPLSSFQSSQRTKSTEKGSFARCSATPSGQKIPVVHCCRSSFSIASPDFVANDADSSSYLDETDVSVLPHVHDPVAVQPTLTMRSAQMVAAASNRAGPAQWMR